MFVITMAGFLYAVLRHRVVDVSVFIDRTLVYGGMTALVVGILAAVNSLVEHAALGTNASLLVQVIVPLALGIVLSRVRLYLDRIVEQVFFRRKYLAEKALRRFARTVQAMKTHKICWRLRHRSSMKNWARRAWHFTCARADSMRRQASKVTFLIQKASRLTMQLLRRRAQV
jgi:hypothetical protein